MKVVRGASTPTPAESLAKARSYVQTARRHWYLLLGLSLVGAALGWISTPAAPDAPTRSRQHRYQAIHTIIRPATTAGGDASTYAPSLAQAAYLVNEGDVPRTVAPRLGLEVTDVVGYVVGIPRNEVNSIEVKAISTDPERAVQLADTSADVLLEYLGATVTARYEADLAQLTDRLDRLQGDLDATNLQLLVTPDDQALLSQRDSLADRRSVTVSERADLIDQGSPDPALQSLEPATATTISQAQFDHTREEIATGLSYVTGIIPVEPEAASVGAVSPVATGPAAPMRAVSGAIVGLGLAIGAVATLNRFDTRLRHRQEVETATGLTVLAEIPPLSRHQQHAWEVLAHTQLRSRAAEANRVVRSALLFAVEANAATPKVSGDGALVVMVTSANPDEGKTTTVANLAAVLAEGGFRVLVVNCDFRRPKIHRYLVAETSRTQDQPSATNLDDANRVTVVPTIIDRVKLITGLGEHDPAANPLDVVAMQRRVIDLARSRYDVILLDTAPFLTTNDASELLGQTDQVLMVVRAGKTRESAAQRAAEILARFDAPVLGVVMTDSDETPAAQYYYTYYLDGTGSRKRPSDHPTAGRDDGRTSKMARSTPKVRSLRL